MSTEFVISIAGNALCGFASGVVLALVLIDLVRPIADLSRIYMRWIFFLLAISVVAASSSLFLVAIPKHLNIYDSSMSVVASGAFLFIGAFLAIVSFKSNKKKWKELMAIYKESQKR